jgi:hypothetical protein
VERPRRIERFARLIQRPARVLGGPAVSAAFGGNLSLMWSLLTAHEAWVDYAYVIGPDRLQVLTSLHGGWQPIAEPAWTDSPDWDAIGEHASRVRGRGWP